MSLRKLLGIRWDNFFLDYFEKDCIPLYYVKNQDVRAECQSQTQKLTTSHDRIIVLNCIPPYLVQHTTHLNSGLKAITRQYRNGYLLNFQEQNTAEDFLRKTYGSKGFKKIKRDFRKLEQEQAALLKVYFGQIDRDLYSKLMNQLKGMITARFGKRARSHFALNRWEFYFNTAFDMVNSGKASLMVYYSNEKPIAISLNYHKNGVFDSAITSFNPAYSQYGLGKLLLIQKIYWCYTNGYNRMDMGWGDFPHKSKIANHVYQYHTQFIYREGRPVDRMFAQFLGFILQKKYELQSRYSRISGD
jgi:hypothetical protein